MKWFVLIALLILMPIVEGVGYLELPARMEYKTGETMTLYAQVLNEDKDPVDNATCSVKVYYPDRTVWVDNEDLTHLSEDLYYYSKTIPDTIGVYPFEVNCSYPIAYGAEVFHVAGWTTDINEIEDEVGLLEDIEEQTDKIPGMKQSVNLISAGLQNLGISQKKSFLYSFVLLVLILIMVIIAVIVFVWHSLRVKFYEIKETESSESEGWI